MNKDGKVIETSKISNKEITITIEEARELDFDMDKIVDKLYPDNEEWVTVKAFGSNYKIKRDLWKKLQQKR